MAAAIIVEDVSKHFRLYHEKYSSLKEKVVNFGRKSYDDFWALRDVSFEVRKGEIFGIIGRNGAAEAPGARRRGCGDTVVCAVSMRGI